MVKVMLDTNVLLDALDPSRLDYSVSLSLVDRILGGGGEACLAATSLKDSYYLASKTLGEAFARRAVQSMMDTMTVIPVDFDCCEAALRSTEPDFEDGIIRAAAEIAHADHLVTRDAHAFVGSTVLAISPADLLRQLEAGSGGS